MRRPGLAMRMTPDIALTIMSPLVFETFTLPEADVIRTSLPISVAETEPLAGGGWAPRPFLSTRTGPEAGCTFTRPGPCAKVFAPVSTIGLKLWWTGTWRQSVMYA